MDIQTVVGSHVYEYKPKDNNTIGAIKKLLMPTAACRFSKVEQRECLDILLGMAEARLRKLANLSSAAGELSLLLVVDDLESALCEWMKFSDLMDAMATGGACKKRRISS